MNEQYRKLALYNKICIFRIFWFVPDIHACFSPRRGLNQDEMVLLVIFQKELATGDAWIIYQVRCKMRHFKNQHKSLTLESLGNMQVVFEIIIGLSRSTRACFQGKNIAGWTERMQIRNIARSTIQKYFTI